MPISSYLRPRYSLRALLAVMTLLAAWCGYSVDWIRQRDAALDVEHIDVGMVSVTEWMNGPPAAPGMLWLFGEEGYLRICFDINEGWEQEQRRLASLFPEAEIVRGR